MTAWVGNRGHQGKSRWMRRVRATAMVGLVAGVTACGVTAEEARSDTARADAIKEEKCIALAKEYADALPDALLCDPASPSDSCAARRPVVVYEVEGSSARLTGLSSCAAPVNATRTAKLDEVLQRYTAAGCDLHPTPCLWNGSPGTDTAPPCRARPDGVGSCNG